MTLPATGGQHPWDRIGVGGDESRTVARRAHSPLLPGAGRLAGAEPGFLMNSLSARPESGPGGLWYSPLVRAPWKGPDARYKAIGPFRRDLGRLGPRRLAALFSARG